MTTKALSDVTATRQACLDATDAYRSAIVDAHHSGLSVAAIADAAGLSQESVHLTLIRARRDAEHARPLDVTAEAS